MLSTQSHTHASSPWGSGDDAVERLQGRLAEASSRRVMTTLRSMSKEDAAQQRHRMVDWVRCETVRKLMFAEDVRTLHTGAAKARHRSHSGAMQSLSASSEAPREPGPSGAPTATSTATPSAFFSRKRQGDKSGDLKSRHRSASFCSRSRSMSPSCVAAEHARLARTALRMEEEERRGEVLRQLEEKRLRGDIVGQYRVHQVEQVRAHRFAARGRRRKEVEGHDQVLHKHAAQTHRSMQGALAAAETDLQRQKRDAEKKRLSLALLSQRRAELEEKQKRREEAAGWRRQQLESKRRSDELDRVNRRLKRSCSAEVPRPAHFVSPNARSPSAAASRRCVSPVHVPQIERSTYTRLLGSKAGCLDAMTFASKRRPLTSKSPVKSPAKEALLSPPAKIPVWRQMRVEDVALQLKVARSPLLKHYPARKAKSLSRAPPATPL